MLCLLLILVFVRPGESQIPCSSTKPITGNCDCHFIGACDWTTAPPTATPTAANSRPNGVDTTFGSTHLTTMCEGSLESIAILYDCDLLIPLYSARVLDDADMKATYSAKTHRTNFRETKLVTTQYRQKNGDYGPKARDQIPCYESTISKPKGTMLFETNWYPAALKYGGPPVKCKPRTVKKKHPSTIDKGHMIAANYGKSATNVIQTVSDTFTLSNIVPQFSKLNQGSWVRNEQILLNWASSHCASTGGTRRSGRLFIVVGEY